MSVVKGGEVLVQGGVAEFRGIVAVTTGVDRYSFGDVIELTFTCYAGGVIRYGCAVFFACSIVALACVWLPVPI